MTYTINWTQWRMLGGDNEKVRNYINKTFGLRDEVVELIVLVRPEDEELKRRLGI